jgi:agmatine deiminase
MIHFPAEWSPQAGVLLTWPHPASDWVSCLAEIEATYDQLAHVISEREPVYILAYDLEHGDYIRHRLRRSQASHISILPCPTDDTWIRDYGPVSVQQDEVWSALNFCFNAWGEKHPYHLDQAVNRTLAWELGLKLKDLSLVVEGGNLETDGRGTLAQCAGAIRLPIALSPEIEFDSTVQRYLEQLRTELGVQTCWILHTAGLIGDDTDGHVDNLLRFSPQPQQLLYSYCDDQRNPNFVELNKLHRQVAQLAEEHPQFRELIALPIPQQLLMHQKQPVPANYCNYLVINDAVLVPSYNDANDAVAQERIAHCFPERQIIAIDSRTLIQQGGSIHCATMQLPMGII